MRPQCHLGGANTIIRFTENVLRREGEGIVDTLKTMRTEHLERTRAAYPSRCAPNAPVSCIR